MGRVGKVAAGGIRRLLAVLCLLAAWGGPVAGDALPASGADGDDHRWDCWVSSEDRRGVISYLIRCIHDRPLVDPALLVGGSVEGLLDYVHQMIHARQFVALDRDLESGLRESLAGYLWSIRIHQYPYDESWDAELPQRLVRAALCTETEACPVAVFR